jgi:hypothetical protein
MGASMKVSWPLRWTEVATEADVMGSMVEQSMNSRGDALARVAEDSSIS